LWGHSASLGSPWAGALRGAVELPAAGAHYFTWDPLLHRRPDRAWRRWGSDRLVATVLRVVDAYAAAHPHAPPVGIGDLSRPFGGPFGPRHVSHQNGLDVDVYYPRRDRRERPPDDASQIDRRLAQDLVDRFVRAGAQRVFVGPNTHLQGPPSIVQVLSGHDNHLHVRLAPTAGTPFPVGRSARGRPIHVLEVGDPSSAHRILVVGCIHGNEAAGLAVTRLLARSRPRVDLWIVPVLNPDGYAGGYRQNGDGVDLNRNFGAQWRPIGRPWDPQYSGPRPWSEPETRFARALILRIRPEVTIWFHQPQGIVRAWGGSIPGARRFARAAGAPFRAIRWLAGTAPNWQNHRFPGTASFVVELPPGPLTATAPARYARAVLTVS
jgi:protein MpaA